MRKLSLMLSALFFGSLPLAAQNNAGADQFPLKTVSNMPSNFYLTELKNGLEVLVVEDHSVPLATIELAVHNGAFVQTPDLEGLAHLYEHMFFKANKDYPSQEAYLDRINELGIVFNGTTSEERVNYFITLGKSKLQEGLEFLNSSARYPKFLKEEMAKENVVVAGEFQRNESSPVFYLFRDMNKRLWGKEISRKNTIGEYKVILNATPEIMQSIKDRYYYPNNSILVIAGDVNHDEIFPKVQSIYGDWQRSTFNIFEKYPIPEFPKLKYSQSFITESPNARVPIVMMSWQGPDTRNSIQSTYAADVFSFILSQQSAKLQKVLVESGLAYQVSVNYATMRYGGPIQVLMVPNPQSVKEAMDALQDQINQWSDPAYYTDDQIATAKEMLEISDLYGKEKTSDYVHTVTYWWASASMDYFTNYINNIKKVTRQDIVNYVNTYIKGQPHITGILVSPQLRQMVSLDQYFTAVDNIDSLRIQVTGNDVATFDNDADATISKLAYLMKMNPDKKLTVNVYAGKKKFVGMRVREITSRLTKAGIPADKFTVVPIVKKEKDLTAEEMSKRNTITFSF